MLAYYGVIHKDATSDYGISWPDFPGCISAGTTREELDVMAREALQFFIEEMKSDGEMLPEPSSRDQVYDAYMDDEGFVDVVLVPVPSP